MIQYYRGARGEVVLDPNSQVHYTSERRKIEIGFLRWRMSTEELKGRLSSLSGNYAGIESSLSREEKEKIEKMKQGWTKEKEEEELRVRMENFIPWSGMNFSNYPES